MILVLNGLKHIKKYGSSLAVASGYPMVCELEHRHQIATMWSLQTIANLVYDSNNNGLSDL